MKHTKKTKPKIKIKQTSKPHVKHSNPIIKKWDLPYRDTRYFNMIRFFNMSLNHFARMKKWIATLSSLYEHSKMLSPTNQQAIGTRMIIKLQKPRTCIFTSSSSTTPTQGSKTTHLFVKENENKCFFTLKDIYPITSPAHLKMQYPYSCYTTMQSIH